MAKKYMSENDYKNADYTNGYAKNEADKACLLYTSRCV